MTIEQIDDKQIKIKYKIIKKCAPNWNWGGFFFFPFFHPQIHWLFSQRTEKKTKKKRLNSLVLVGVVCTIHTWGGACLSTPYSPLCVYLLSVYYMPPPPCVCSSIYLLCVLPCVTMSPPWVYLFRECIHPTMCTLHRVHRE